MLPLLLYTAAKAYGSRKRAAAQDLAFERQNAVYEYGYGTDERGNPTGTLRQYNPEEDTRDRWQGKYLKFGIEGQVQPITSGTKIEEAYTDLNNKVTGRKRDFFDQEGNPLEGTNPIMTGQFIDGEFKSFPSELLKQLQPEDKDAEQVTRENPVGYIVRGDNSVHDNLFKARAHAVENDYDVNQIFYRTSTEVKKGDQTTSFTFDDKDISAAANAANKAAKPPLLEIRYADDKTEPFQFFSIGTSDAITPDTLTRLDTQLGSLNLNTMEDINKFDRNSYEDFLRGVSGSVVRAYTDVDPQGVKLGVNFRLYNDVDTFLRNDYGNLYDLPGFREALTASVNGRRDLDLSSVFDKLSRENKVPRVTTLTNEDDPAIPPGQKMDIVTGDTPAEAGVLDKLRSHLLSDRVGMTQQDTEKFFTDVMFDYKPGTSLTEKAESQPKITFVNSLFSRTVAGTNVTLFTKFVDLVTQYDSNYNRGEDELLTEFTSAFGTFEEQVAFIEAINPRFQDTSVPGYHYRAYTNNAGNASDFANFREENRAVEKAYGNAERFLTGFYSTYTLGDGSPLNIGAKQGEIVLTVDGALFVYDEFVRPQLGKIPVVGDMLAGATKVGGTIDQQYNTIKNAVFARSDNIERFAELSTAEQQAYLDERGITTPLQQYLEDERAANAALQQEFDALAQGATRRNAQGQFVADDDAQINLKLAMRGYYRYMSAYALASATQGGTGGRTISDQDVLNFLRAFQTEKLLSNPDTERRVIGQILTEVKAQKKIAANLAAGGSTAAATMKILSMPGSEFIGMNMNDYAQRVGVKGYGKQGVMTSTEEAAAGPTSIQILQRISELQIENGDPPLDVPSNEGAAKAIVDSLRDNPFYFTAVDELNEEMGSN